ncbi:MAG: FAD-dependent oxidoreductase [Candidatus Eremiobacteraeota bacterium]|nr:FAD-dependent oxidoreductase [Candidatus Eremiobacteraeota bacterium]
MKQIKNIVVIGASGTGALAALMAKKLNPSLDVTIIREREERGLLTRCATPYICCGEVLVNPSYKDDSIFTDQGITLIDSRAIYIDRKGETVTTEDEKIYPYDKLVLATGAKPAVPPISGSGLPGVFTLRTSGDAVSIHHWINTRRVRNAVLIGAGAIGIEIAYLIAKREVKVAVVEMLDHILPQALDKDMTAGVEVYVKDRGIDLRLNERVNAITGKDQVDGVLLSSNDRIKAELVIISAGVRLRSELAKKAGLEMGRLGLKVNSYLQTSDPDIYSAGDLIEYPSHVMGKPILGQLRPNAVIGGRIIAKNILGYKIKFPPLVNSFATKFFDKSIAGTGITEVQAKNEGIDTVSAIQSSTDKHSMVWTRKPYTVKLIFNRENEKIIGGQIVSDSECPIKHIDAIAIAIRSGWTALDLTTLRCAGQPELSPDPGKEPIALAAEAAYIELHQENISRN